MQTSYLLCVLSLIFIIHITPLKSLATTSCTSNADCGSNGICSNSTNNCNCTTAGYVTFDSNKPCAYEQKKKTTAFCLSFFLGAVGADWYYLSAGSTVYIVIGVSKMLTLGGLGVWALTDWIRILAGTFPDGQGVALQDWT